MPAHLLWALDVLLCCYSLPVQNGCGFILLQLRFRDHLILKQFLLRSNSAVPVPGWLLMHPVRHYCVINGSRRLVNPWSSFISLQGVYISIDPGQHLSFLYAVAFFYIQLCYFAGYIGLIFTSTSGYTLPLAFTDSTIVRLAAFSTETFLSYHLYRQLLPRGITTIKCQEQ